MGAALGQSTRASTGPEVPRVAMATGADASSRVLSAPFPWRHCLRGRNPGALSKVRKAREPGTLAPPEEAERRAPGAGKAGSGAWLPPPCARCGALASRALAAVPAGVSAAPPRPCRSTWGAPTRLRGGLGLPQFRRNHCGKEGRHPHLREGPTFGVIIQGQAEPPRSRI